MPLFFAKHELPEEYENEESFFSFSWRKMKKSSFICLPAKTWTSIQPYWIVEQEWHTAAESNALIRDEM